VQNTLQVIEANSDRSLIVSPVISRSVENIAIDIAAARKLGTKVYLEGKWLQLVKQAMTDSGHLELEAWKSGDRVCCCWMGKTVVVLGRLSEPDEALDVR
jgi:hypothetical protein